MLTISDFETLPGALSGRALNNWLRTDGAGIFSVFDTGADTLRFMRAAGVDMPSSTFYSIRRQVLSVVNSSQPLLGYPDNQLIPLQWHVTDHGLALSSKYQYRIHLFGTDPESGTLNDKWMTVASNRQLTPNQVKDVARSWVGEGGDSGDIDSFLFAEIEPLRR